MKTSDSSQKTGPADSCGNCEKPQLLCLCDALPKPPIKSRVRVLVLQHPQEPDVVLGTGRLVTLALENAKLRVGLSWPNLGKALGQEATPSRWATLYLGSGLREVAQAGSSLRDSAQPRSGLHEDAPATGRRPPGLFLVDKKAVPLDSLRPDRDLDGLIVLDGTWSQAKAIWWRNAWLLKTRRAILIPSRKSLYGDLRREPRRECLSTLESVAESLTAMGEPRATHDALVALFAELLKRVRDSRKPRARASASAAELSPSSSSTSTAKSKD